MCVCINISIYIRRCNEETRFSVTPSFVLTHSSDSISWRINLSSYMYILTSIVFKKQGSVVLITIRCQKKTYRVLFLSQLF